MKLFELMNWSDEEPETDDEEDDSSLSATDKAAKEKRKTSVMKAMTVDERKILKVLLSWYEHNTPAVGKLVVPAKFKRVDNDVLYRGVMLNPDLVKDLKAGKTVQISSKGFSSWTHARKVAKRFLEDEGNFRTGLIIKKDPAKMQVVIDIGEFFFRTRARLLDFVDRDEQEVIVKDNEYTLTVSPDEVEFV